MNEWGTPPLAPPLRLKRGRTKRIRGAPPEPPVVANLIQLSTRLLRRPPTRTPRKDCKLLLGLRGGEQKESGGHPPNHLWSPISFNSLPDCFVVRQRGLLAKTANFSYAEEGENKKNQGGPPRTTCGRQSHSTLYQIASSSANADSSQRLQTSLM